MKEQGGPCHFSTIWHCDNRAGSRWASVWTVCPRARSLTVTYRRPCVENGPFFTSKLHPLYCPWEWQNSRHEDQYNRDERHEILLGKWECQRHSGCHCAINSPPPKWFHVSVSAASAAMTTTGNNETWETSTVLTFINNVWCRYEQHVTVGFSGWFFFFCVVCCGE